MNNNQNNFNVDNQDNNIINQNYIPNNQNFNQPLNVIPTINPNNNMQNNTINTDNPPELNRPQNKFINENIDITSNSLDSLNIERTNQPTTDYSKDPKVIENLNKKNTITITSEGKIFIIIIIVLLLFIIILPTIFDFISSIKYQ